MNGLAGMLLQFESHYDVDVSRFDLTVPKVILECAAPSNKRFTSAGSVLSNMIDMFS